MEAGLHDLRIVHRTRPKLTCSTFAAALTVLVKAGLHHVVTQLAIGTHARISAGVHWAGAHRAPAHRPRAHRTLSVHCTRAGAHRPAHAAAHRAAAKSIYRAAVHSVRSTGGRNHARSGAAHTGAWLHKSRSGRQVVRQLATTA